MMALIKAKNELLLKHIQEERKDLTATKQAVAKMAKIKVQNDLILKFIKEERVALREADKANRLQIFKNRAGKNKS